MSSLIYLGFSLIAFATSFGFVFLIMPMIFGSFYGVADTLVADLPTEWQNIYEQQEDTVQWLPNVLLMVGIFFFVLKTLMVASVRGRD